MEPEEFGKLVKKILSDPKKVYVIALIGVVIFPPTESASTGYDRGWQFITAIGGNLQINTTYLIIEFVIITVIYYLFRKKN